MANVKETWLTETLCSLGEKVRVERGPQVVTLPCTDENLRDDVTHNHYKVGRRDAEGRLIRPDDREVELADDAQELARFKAAREQDFRTPIGKGEPMKVADWAGGHAVWVWKIYRVETVYALDADGAPVERQKFVKVDEVEGKDDALARAHEILKGEK